MNKHKLPNGHKELFWSEQQKWAKELLVRWEETCKNTTHQKAFTHLYGLSTQRSKERLIQWTQEAADLGLRMQEVMVFAILQRDSIGDFINSDFIRDSYHLVINELQSRVGPPREKPPKGILELYDQALEVQIQSPRLALNSLEKAIGLCSSRQLPLTYATILNAAGYAYNQLGDYSAALEHFEKASEILESIAPRSFQTSTTLNNIGNVHQALGHVGIALKYYEEALGRDKDITLYSSQTARDLINIGYAFDARNEFDAALDYYRQALEICRVIVPCSNETAAALNNAGYIYQLLGEPDLALSYYMQALEIFQAIAPHSSQEASALNNIGFLHQGSGQLDLALNYYEEALRIDQSIAPNSSASSVRLNNIGHVHERRGQLDVALTYYERALEINNTIAPSSVDISRDFNNIGNVYIKKKEYAKAESYLERGAKVVEDLRSWAGGTEEARMGIAEAAEGENLFTNLVICKTRLDKLKEAFAASEGGKAKGLLELLKESQIARSRVEPKIRNKISNLQGKVAVLERRLIDLRQERALLRIHPAEGTSSYQQLAKEITSCIEEQTQAKRELEELVTRLHAECPEFANLQYPKLLSLEEAQVFLSEDTLVLEFCATPQGTCVFALTRDKFTGIETTEIPRNSINILVQEWIRPFVTVRDLSSISEHEMGERWKKYLNACHLIYKNLLEPFKELFNSAKRLVIVPDDHLYILPFESVVVELKEGNPVYFGDLYPISYIPSLAVMKHIIEQLRLRRQPIGEEFIGFGDPDCEKLEDEEIRGKCENLFGALSMTRADFRHLPHTREEVLTIGEMLTKEKRPEAHRLLEDPEAQDWRAGVARVLVRSKASEKVAKKETGEAHVLHFATHGFLDDKKGMNCGLVLSPTAAIRDSTEIEKYDYLLQVFEIFELDVAAELVVLSACSTGLGEIKRGEGIIGMTRAWFYAGVPNVVVSLWPVDDTSTSLFMRKFYEELYGLNCNEKPHAIEQTYHRSFNVTPSEALRRARLYLRDVHGKESDHKLIYSHPFFWAPFVHYGIPFLSSSGGCH